MYLLQCISAKANPENTCSSSLLIPYFFQLPLLCCIQCTQIFGMIFAFKCNPISIRSLSSNLCVFNDGCTFTHICVQVKSGCFMEFSKTTLMSSNETTVYTISETSNDLDLVRLQTPVVSIVTIGLVFRSLFSALFCIAC